MQNFARLAKTAGQKAVPVVVAGAASSSVALADAPREEVIPPNRCLLHDAWEFAELEKDVVLFKPAEIDEAVSELCRRPQSAVIEELDASDISSDGTVDDILECGIHTGADTSVGLPLSMGELVTMASRMLKSPGLQREMILAALSDPEVFSILESKVDLPQYLEYTGFAAKGLLQGPQEGSSSTPVQDAGSTTADKPAGANPVLLKAAEGIEHVGNAVARLGRWMRTRILGETASADTGARTNKRVDYVLGAVMTVCVAIIAVVVLKRPAALTNILKRIRVVRRL